MIYKKNDMIRLRITDITSEGAGVGRTEDGYVVFVPMTAPGDECEVKILKAGKSWAYGRAESFVTQALSRTDPVCPVFAKCGGCALRHITYEEELNIKKSWVADSFRKIGGFDADGIRIYSAGQPDRYRNKAEYPAGTDADGRLRFGMYAPRSHRVIPCADCLLTPAFYGDIVRAVEDWCAKTGLSAYEDGEGRGIVRHLYIRDARATGEVSVSLIVKARSLPDEAGFVSAVRAACPSAASVSIIPNMKAGNEILGDSCRILWGKDTITDVLCGLKFEISPLSFYQVNRDGAELLYTRAREATALTGDETLLDLYCGAGTIGLSFSDRIRKLYGVEIIPEAIENAKKNAARNGVANAEFFCGDAGDAAVRLADAGVRPDVVVVDPPRKGCSDAVFDAVAAMRPQKITMISCNHATGARDAARFRALGYELRELFAVDLFPRTAHVECVASFILP